MRVFALFDRWARSKLKSSEENSRSRKPADEDHSSMADLVRLLTEIDLADGSRAPR